MKTQQHGNDLLNIETSFLRADTGHPFLNFELSLHFDVHDFPNTVNYFPDCYNQKKDPTSHLQKFIITKYAKAHNFRWGALNNL